MKDCTVGKFMAGKQEKMPQINQHVWSRSGTACRMWNQVARIWNAIQNLRGRRIIEGDRFQGHRKITEVRGNPDQATGVTVFSEFVHAARHCDKVCLDN